MESSHIPYDQLIAFAAGESNEAESANISAHTSACAECTTTLVWFKTVRGLMRADPTREPPAAMVARARAIFSSNPVAPSRFPHLSFSPLFQVARRFSAAAVLAAVLVVLVLFFGGVGTAAAATSGSLPGDALYPVKIAVESLQLAVTLDPVDKARLHVSLAETRIKEIQALDAKGEDEEIPATAQSYTDHVGEAEKLLTLAKEQNRPVADAARQMQQVVTQSNSVLAVLLDTLPAQARPAIARAIDASKGAETGAPALQPGSGPLPPVRGKPTATQGPNTSSSNGQCGDSTPPSLTVTVSPSVLWPPDHKYVTVTATVNAADNKDPNPQVALVSVTSSDPDSGQGDGDLPIDIVIVNNFTFQLRAERSTNGPGRVYTITYSATDACGNVKSASAIVTVPHNQPEPGGQKTPGQPNNQPAPDGQKTPPGKTNDQSEPGGQKTPPGQDKSP